MAVTRGTTPTHIFNTDTDLTDAEVVYVTYKQRGSTIIEKTIDELDLKKDKVQLTLTQDETLLFDTTAAVTIQIRARYPDGTAIASNILMISANSILKEGVI